MLYAETSTNQSSHIAELSLSDWSKFRHRLDYAGFFVYRIGSWSTGSGWLFFAVLLSPVLDGFDQLIKLYCTVLAVN